MRSQSWENLLERWTGASLIDASTADRIRAFEKQNPESPESKGLHWPVLLAIVFGCVMVGAGVLLFVAAHWDNLSPAQRFAIVLTMVAGFHVMAAFFADPFPKLSTALHGVGTVALGAGIFLAGQIFNLAEHWPGGIMLWAIGAWLAWLLLDDWVQATLVALLVPAWLAGEWEVRVWDQYHRGGSVMTCSLLILAVSYFTAARRDETSYVRRALMWIGGLALIPCAFAAIYSSWEEIHWTWWGRQSDVPWGLLIVGWGFGILVPLALAYRLRGSAAWMNVLAVGWVVVLAVVSRVASPENNLALYLWCLLGSVGMIYWGLHEFRKERINFGIVGFAFTVFGFYFSSIMDKLGRSTMLISLGALFLLGGWLLERTRRRLVARISGGVA